MHILSGMWNDADADADIAHFHTHTHTLYWASIFKTNERNVREKKQRESESLAIDEKRIPFYVIPSLSRSPPRSLARSLPHIFIAAEGFILCSQKWLHIRLFLTFVGHIAFWLTQWEQKKIYLKIKLRNKITKRVSRILFKKKKKKIKANNWKNPIWKVDLIYLK